MAALGDAALGICIYRRHSPALAEVCRRHGGALHALAARVCGPGCAEVVVAEVLMELWWQPQLFNPETSSLRAHLLGRVHTGAVEMARATGARTSPSGAGAFTEHGVDIHAAQVLAGLSGTERTAIALAYLGGYHCAEIAEAIAEPVVVAARLRSGLRALGDCAEARKEAR